MQDCKHNCTHKIYLTARAAKSVIQIMPQIVTYYSPRQTSCCRTAVGFSAWFSAGYHMRVSDRGRIRIRSENLTS